MLELGHGYMKVHHFIFVFENFYNKVLLKRWGVPLGPNKDALNWEKIIELLTGLG